MINLDSYAILKQNISTLHELSKDGTNNVYMTDSNMKAINFDAVKTQYANELGLTNEVAKSVDALVFVNELNLLIEFKNGDMKKKNTNVKNKIRDSLLILCDILDCTVSNTRENFSFILVYNQEKEKGHNHKSRDNIENHINEKANNEKILFDLGTFKNFYFKEVHTYNEDEFGDFLSHIEDDESGLLLV